MFFFRPIRKSFLTEVQFDGSVAAGAKKKFGDQPIFRNFPIYKITCCTASSLSKSPSQFTVVSEANIVTAVLVLAIKGSKEDIKQIPLYDLVPYLNAGLFREFDGLYVNWNSSYIQLLGAGIAQNEAFVLNVFYDFPPNYKPEK